MIPVLDLMNQLIGVQRNIADDSFYHTPLSVGVKMYPARVEIQPGVLYGKDGRTLPTYAKVYTTAEVNVGDDLLLPDGSVRQVLAVLKAVDGDGIFSHSVVTV